MRVIENCGSTDFGGELLPAPSSARKVRRRGRRLEHVPLRESQICFCLVRQDYKRDFVLHEHYPLADSQAAAILLRSKESYSPGKPIGSVKLHNSTLFPKRVNPWSAGLFALGLLASSCAEAPLSLTPQGPAAEQIASLGWIMTGLGTVVFVFVVVVLLLALFRPRPAASELEISPKDNERSRSAHTWIVGGGIVLPVVILIGILGFTLTTMRSIAGLTPSDEMVIEVTGHQWWWEVHYPTRPMTTANEIHIPVGQPVTLKLTSKDVIHSLWVPELHGKFDLIPGKTTTMILQADQPGDYYGQCAEFCGIQHAKMAFLVIAEAPETFLTWLEAQTLPASAPSEPLTLQGRQVFLESGCTKCHTLRGTNAAGEDGPDLTHLASRSTLAAATLTNTREHLMEWISDPQKLKPGNRMPKIELGAAELEALVAYLESLK